LQPIEGLAAEEINNKTLAIHETNGIGIPKQHVQSMGIGGVFALKVRRTFLRTGTYCQVLSSLRHYKVASAVRTVCTANGKYSSHQC
jgi:hypothetical protein